MMYKSIYRLKKYYFSVVKLDKCYVHRDGNIKNCSNEEKLKIYKNFNDIPGPKVYPFIGALYKYLPFIGDYKAETLDKNALLNWHRYGSLTRESLTPEVQILHVFDPDDIETVFRHEGKLPARRSHTALKHYRLNKPQIYNTGGLLSSNGPEWWKLRSSFQKNFSSPKSVQGHLEITDVVVKEFINWIKDIGVTPMHDFLPFLNRLNLEVIGVVAFSKRFNSFSPEEQNVKSISSKVIDAAFGSNGGIVKLDKGFLWKIVKTPLYSKLVSSQECLERVAMDILRKKEVFTKDHTNKSLILGSFLRQENVDEKDVIGMMVDILMASIDTTAYSTSFMLYHLSRNSECQKLLFKEISNLLPTKDTAITVEVLKKAHYTRCCVKESLRLNPVSIGVGRVTQTEIVLKGYLIPKGTIIVTQNMIASRLPQFVKDPLAFKPDRWMRDSNSYENLHPFLILPFGFGPRSCIARRLAEQTMTISLIRLIQEFHLSWAGEELGITTHLINKPDKPVRLWFQIR